jgi:hypothetical protein
MVSMLWRGLLWSNSTRLLNTAMKGATVAVADSSWIEALGGLVLTKARSVPPDFCAAAGPLDSAVATASRTAAVIVRPLMSPSPCLRTPG